MVTDKMVCSNCQQQSDSKFCGSCGHSMLPNERLVFSNLCLEIIHSILHTGGGLLLTMNRLFTEPQVVFKDYISGKRKHIFSPIKFFLIASVIYLAISHWIDSSENNIETQKIEYIISQYKYIFIFGNVFVNSFFNWFFFKNYKYNLSEHFVVMLYVQAVVFLISSLTMTINYLLQAGIYLSILSIFYYLYALTKFFNQEFTLKTIFINIIVFVLSTIIFYLPVVLIAY